MGKCGIYKITNLINNRIYIGSTNNFAKRKQEHFTALKYNRHANQFLQRDCNKCGIENFIFEIILETNCEDLLLDFEQRYLDQYWDEQVNCYNISLSANNPNRGRSLSKEHKRKISEANKGNKSSLGRKVSEETKNKIAEAQRGKKRKPISEEQKKIISQANKGNKHCLGKKHSDETKRKQSEALRLTLNKPEVKIRRSIAASKTQYFFVDPKGKTVEFFNLVQFCRTNGLHLRSMRRVISGERKSHKGWRLP